ncbi:EcsC family protein [Polaribacter sp. Z014]|uniref:EcsC family protein n=1 Tax=unclassified Polaribacter TaxID=196858 RepID=UPI00193C26E8|nr:MULTISPECIES: EcsC family protein [unclassified Polaribacter]MCL7763165.1 EcsC family protein [Polaribacter sp. Z014]QVY67103.1 EcsC family protein [Polaribacter sp. Q13]
MSKEVSFQKLSTEDFEALKKAKQTMNNLGWAIRNVNKIGNTIEDGMNYIPDKTLVRIQKITKSVLLTVIKANLITIQKNKKFKKPSKHTYKAIVTSSGALSGFLGSTTGIGTLIFTSELTITTKFIMRTILDIARSEGEDIYTLEGQMACLEVFALGGDSNKDDGMESSYYTTRIALNSALKNISASGVKVGIETLLKSVSSVGTNVITNFISKIATQLSLLISEKFLAQAIPVLGAIGGASLNFVFVNHFQEMASAHFKVRQLERKYGALLVQETYNSILIEEK